MDGTSRAPVWILRAEWRQVDDRPRLFHRRHVLCLHAWRSHRQGPPRRLTRGWCARSHAKARARARRDRCLTRHRGPSGVHRCLPLPAPLPRTTPAPSPAAPPPAHPLPRPSPRLSAVLTGHERTPWTVKFHPRSRRILASGSLDQSVRTPADTRIAHRSHNPRVVHRGQRHQTPTQPHASTHNTSHESPPGLSVQHSPRPLGHPE